MFCLCPVLRVDVCKYQPEVAKTKFLKIQKYTFKFHGINILVILWMSSSVSSRPPPDCFFKLGEFTKEGSIENQPTGRLKRLHAWPLTYPSTAWLEIENSRLSIVIKIVAYLSLHTVTLSMFLFCLHKNTSKKKKHRKDKKQKKSKKEKKVRVELFILNNVY